MKKKPNPASDLEMKDALERYADLYNFAPVGYFTLTRDGTISQTNPFGEDLLLVERNSLIHQRFDQFIQKDLRSSFQNYLDQVFRSHVKETCEVELLIKGKRSGWIQMEAVATENSAECRAVVIDITARKKAEFELQQLSMHDALTGLYNRAYFYESIKHLERGRHFPISILIADLDHFKMINDKFGHDIGDTLLVRAAQMLTKIFRSDDIVARIGGDEFAILLPETSAETTALILQRFQHILNEHNTTLPDPPLNLTFGRYTAEMNDPLDQSIKLADADLYFRKRERTYPADRENPANTITATELRKRAEEQHLQNYKPIQKPRTEVDLLRLVHELEVHQIELDIQNEELLRSRAELEDALERFTDLYDFAPVGYFSLEPDGTIVQANLHGAQLLGTERSHLVGDPFNQFVREEDRTSFANFLEKLFTGRAKASCQLALLQGDPSPHWVQIEGTIFGDQKRCRIVVVDIHARKLAEEKLQRVQSQLDQLLEKFDQARQVLQKMVGEK